MKRIMFTGLAMIAAAAAAGPAHAGNVDSGAIISYWFPKAALAATAVVTLRSCGAAPVTSVDLSLAPVADVDLGTPHTFSADTLRSGHVKRDFSITLDEQGRLKTVSSDSQEQTGVMLGSIFKIGLNLLSLHAFKANGATDSSLSTYQCKPMAEAAVNRAAQLRSQIDALRKLGPSAPKGTKPGDPTIDPEAFEKKLGFLTTELTALESGPLRISITGNVELPGAMPPAGDQSLVWPSRPFAAWFMTPIAPKELTAITLSAQSLGFPTEAPPIGRRGKCAASLDVPYPRMMEFTAKDSSQPDAPQLKVSAPVQQWGDGARKVCLDVGMFESRKITFGFDTYGRTTAVGWTSNAPAADALGALAGVTDSLAQYRAAHPPQTELAQTAAAADLAEAQIREIQAQACLAKLRMGMSCDAATSPTP